MGVLDVLVAVVQDTATFVPNAAVTIVDVYLERAGTGSGNHVEDVVQNLPTNMGGHRVGVAAHAIIDRCHRINDGHGLERSLDVLAELRGNGGVRASKISCVQLLDFLIAHATWGGNARKQVF